ncbi:MAG: 3'(2'),5'-bisphosphate nucleotidase CysQ [Bacteroidota bacterium]|nr:3'(2'),5'-bisphosphate nucleotidase CysQ [Bacteroidota bacterium]
MDLKQLIQIAENAAIDAGRSIMEIYDSDEFATEMKDNATPITRADKSAHEIVTQSLSKTGLPILSEEGINVDFKERKLWEYFWLIDPLDGTKEFIHKNGEFTVNIALMKMNVPVAGIIYRPCSGSLYSGAAGYGIFKKEHAETIQFFPLKKRKTLDELLAKENIRLVASRSHPSKETQTFSAQFKKVEIMSAGSSLKFMLLLENKAEVYPRFGTTMEWDTAAAHAILNASNRGVYQTDLASELSYNKPDLRNPFFIAF